MSEILAPLNPEVEVEVSAEVAAPVEEIPQEEDAPEAPDFSKLLQREQQERANMKRDFTRQLEGIHDAIKALGTAKPESRQSKLDQLQQKLKGVEGQSMDPQIVAMLADLTEEVAEARRDGGRVSEVEKRQAEQEAFDAYMEDKPNGFKEAYTKHQRGLVQKYQDRGMKVDRGQLEIAMTEWSDTWIEGKKKPAPASAKTPGVKPVIPASGVRKTVTVEKPDENPFGWTVK